MKRAPAGALFFFSALRFYAPGVNASLRLLMRAALRSSAATLGE